MPGFNRREGDMLPLLLPHLCLKLHLAAKSSKAFPEHHIGNLPAAGMRMSHKCCLSTMIMAASEYNGIRGKCGKKKLRKFTHINGIFACATNRNK